MWGNKNRGNDVMSLLLQVVSGRPGIGWSACGLYILMRFARDYVGAKVCRFWLEHGGGCANWCCHCLDIRGGGCIIGLNCIVISGECGHRHRWFGSTD